MENEYVRNIKREKLLLKKYNLKVCYKCKEIKELSNFSGHYCRECNTIYRTTRYKPKWGK